MTVSHPPAPGIAWSRRVDASKGENIGLYNRTVGRIRKKRLIQRQGFDRALGVAFQVLWSSSVR